MAYVDSQVDTSGQGTENSDNQSQAQSPSLDPNAARQYVLDKISSGEAGSYNELYGGGHFNDYSDHPDVHMLTPTGEKTSAAGKYQFITPTWKAEQAKLGLKDFGPASQDAAAWDLATTTYKQQTGRDLASDAAQKNVNWSALGGQWTSLAGPSKTQSEHIRPPTNDLALPPSPAGSGNSSSAAWLPQGGTAQPGGLQLSPQMKKAMALTWLKSSMANVKLQPVDYDPFAVENAGKGVPGA